MRAALLALGCAALLAGCSPVPSALAGDAREFTVPRGAGARQIAEALKREGWIRCAWQFLAWVELTPTHAPSLRPGVYRFAAGASAREIASAIRKGPPPERLTFPEGWTARQMADLLAARNVVPDAGAFLAIVERDRLEGYLFPDTYVFDQLSAPEAVIHVMRRRFDEMRPADFAERAKALGRSEKDLVILASIIQKEATVLSELPLIAGVYWNRLKRRMKLEADPTVQYALGGWKSRVTYADLKLDSPYNTYRYRGLPPGPICSPGAAALRAAAHPLPSDYLFFVARPDGSHQFSRTYQEHLRAIRALR